MSKPLEARDPKRDIARELLRAIRSMKVGKLGVIDPAEEARAISACQRKRPCRRCPRRQMGVSLH